MGLTPWEYFQKKEGVNFYLFEQNSDKNSFRVYSNPLTKREEKEISLGNLEGIFISKGPLFNGSGEYIGKPFYPFISDMQGFARDNNGEFVHFSSIVMGHYLKNMKDKI